MAYGGNGRPDFTCIKKCEADVSSCIAYREILVYLLHILDIHLASLLAYRNIVFL